MAQVTRISGKVTDASNGEPIPFANVFFKGTSIGVSSNIDGTFLLDTSSPGDSLSVKVMGYVSMSLPVRKGQAQSINFILTEASVELSEVEVLPEEDLIELIMRRVFRNKDANNPDRIEYYECEMYNKVQVDFNNITDKFRERKVFKPFEFVFEHIDTSDFNQKNYLPVFLSESMSDLYFRKSPRTTREFIRANRVSGIENESITQYLGGVTQGVNVYDNYIQLFEKNFASPVASFGLSTYDYVLEDTVIINGRSCFQIRFEPKRKQELTFYGRLYIHDTTMAVKAVNMRIASDANFNFINDFMIRQEYEFFNGQYWAISKEMRLIDFNPLENSNRMLGVNTHRTTSYRNYVFDQPQENDFYGGALNVIVEDGADSRKDEYWQASRHDSLSLEEQKVYEMVDSIKNVPVFHTYEDIVYMITTGYLPARKFEIGPLYKSLSFNSIEGVRLRAGGRTSNSFSKRIQLEGHLAYGFKDQHFKYGLGFLYMLNKNPRRSAGGNFKYDMEQLGQSSNAFSEDNFFAAFFRRSPADKLNMVREYSGFYEHEWFMGFSNTLRFLHRDVYSIGDDKFIFNDGNDQLVANSIISSELQLITRFAFREKYIYFEFDRTSLGTTYPVLELVYCYGVPGLLGGEYEYHRLQFRIKHWFNVMNIGWSKYIFETGKIWGVLPYPMLKIHEGNETILFYENASNLMDYYEFISDTYASLYYTHHFDGLFFNHIPFLRKLKLREVIHGRGVWGSMSQENKEYSEFPVNTTQLDKPYFEAGVGIENILKFGRIDAVWRLSRLESSQADRFRIFISFQFSF